jgi:hypothetical protein
MATGNTNFIHTRKNDGFAGSGFSINGCRADLNAQVTLFAGFNADLTGHIFVIRFCFKLSDAGYWIIKSNTSTPVPFS